MWCFLKTSLSEFNVRFFFTSSAHISIHTGICIYYFTFLSKYVFFSWSIMLFTPTSKWKNLKTVAIFLVIYFITTPSPLQTWQGALSVYYSPCIYSKNSRNFIIHFLQVRLLQPVLRQLLFHLLLLLSAEMVYRPWQLHLRFLLQVQVMFLHLTISDNNSLFTSMFSIFNLCKLPVVY